MQTLIRVATQDDVDTLFPITDGRDEIRANGFYRRLGWSVVERDDVRYQKRRAG